MWGNRNRQRRERCSKLMGYGLQWTRWASEGFHEKSWVRLGWSGEEGVLGDRIPTLRDHECAGEGKGGEKRNGGRRRRGTDGMGGHVLLLWDFVAGVLGDSIKRFGDGLGWDGQHGGTRRIKMFSGDARGQGWECMDERKGWGCWRTNDGVG